MLGRALAAVAAAARRPAPAGAHLLLQGTGWQATAQGSHKVLPARSRLLVLLLTTLGLAGHGLSARPHSNGSSSSTAVACRSAERQTAPGVRRWARVCSKQQQGQGATCPMALPVCCTPPCHPAPAVLAAATHPCIPTATLPLLQAAAAELLAWVPAALQPWVGLGLGQQPQQQQACWGVQLV